MPTSGLTEFAWHGVQLTDAPKLTIELMLLGHAQRFSVLFKMTRLTFGKHVVCPSCVKSAAFSRSSSYEPYDWYEFVLPYE